MVSEGTVDKKQKTRHGGPSVCLHCWWQVMVEARGVEPLSEIISNGTSPGAVCDLVSLIPQDHRQS